MRVYLNSDEESVQKLTRGGRAPRPRKNAGHSDTRTSKPAKPQKGSPAAKSPKSENNNSPKRRLPLDTSSSSSGSSSTSSSSSPKNSDFESKHPRSHGKFAPKGTIPDQKPSGPSKQTNQTPKQRKQAITQVSKDVLRVLGYKGDLQAALKQFQKDAGMKPTGIADQKTLRAMRAKIAGVRTKRKSVSGGMKPAPAAPSSQPKLAPPAKKKQPGKKAETYGRMKKALDEVIVEPTGAVSELISENEELEKRFNPSQPRGPDGKWISFGEFEGLAGGHLTAPGGIADRIQHLFHQHHRPPTEQEAMAQAQARLNFPLKHGKTGPGQGDGIHTPTVQQRLNFPLTTGHTATYTGPTIGPEAAYRGLPTGTKVHVSEKLSNNRARVLDPKTGEWLGDVYENSLTDHRLAAGPTMQQDFDAEQRASQVKMHRARARRLRQMAEQRDLNPEPGLDEIGNADQARHLLDQASHHERQADKLLKDPQVQERLNFPLRNGGRHPVTSAAIDSGDTSDARYQERQQLLGNRPLKGDIPESPYSSASEVKAGGYTDLDTGSRVGSRRVTVRASKREFIYTGQALLDRGNTFEPGRRVRLVKLPGVPGPGTMGQFHVVDSKTGELLGMVSYGSLAPVKK